jgi:hypothetical protein
MKKRESKNQLKELESNYATGVYFQKISKYKKS